MAHKFEISQDILVEASPEQVWEAIATGPGLDSWFMGRNEVEPREGGRAMWSIDDFTLESTVVEWDSPKRFVNRGAEALDGSTHEFDYRIDAREGGGSHIHFVHSGALYRGLGERIQGHERGRPHVPPQVAGVPHLLPSAVWERRSMSADLRWTTGSACGSCSMRVSG